MGDMVNMFDNCKPITRKTRREIAWEKKLKSAELYARTHGCEIVTDAKGRKFFQFPDGLQLSISTARKKISAIRRAKTTRERVRKSA
jgi:hypothetical protein